MTSANNRSGVIGTDGSPDGAFGVQGTSRVGVGVYGVGTSGAYGVQGVSTISSGVYGSSPSGYGVNGNSGFGTGVNGDSTSGVGVQASSSKGTALQVNGKASFSNSGVATVKKNARTVTVKVTGMTKSSIVLATIQHAHSGLSVEAAVPSAGSFTITLTAKAPANTAVGWFVIG